MIFIWNADPLQITLLQDIIANILIRQKCSATDVAVLGFEIFARSRPNLQANPNSDKVDALIFNLSNERVRFSDAYNTKKSIYTKCNLH